MSEIKITINVLKDIALSESERPFAERQRAIDALSLFHEDSMKAFKEISKKADNKSLKDRADLYIQRLEAGAITSLNI